MILKRPFLIELRDFFVYHIVKFFDNIEWFFLLLFTSYFLAQSKLPFAEIFAFVKWGVLLIFVGINILTIALKIESEKLIYDKIYWAILVFVLYLIINSLLSINVVTSVSRSLIFLVTVFVWFFILPNYFNRKELIDKLFNIMFFFFFIIFNINLILTILFPNLYFRIGIYIRYSGITENANTLGMYSLASIIFILYKLQFGKRFEKILSWWMLLLVAINFTLTVSRSSILGAAIIIMIFTFYYHRKWFYAGLIAGALAGLALLIFPILLDVLRLASNPFSYRDQLFELAISKWKEKMLFGQGYGTTLIMTNELFVFLQKGYHYLLIGKHFGNMYLELLCETGLLGFVLFVPIIAILYKKQKKLWRIARGDYKVFLVLYRGLFWGFLIQNFFESALLAPGNGVAFLFWTFSGLLLSLERLMMAQKGTPIT